MNNNNKFHGFFFFVRIKILRILDLRGTYNSKVRLFFFFFFNFPLRLRSLVLGNIECGQCRRFCIHRQGVRRLTMRVEPVHRGALLSRNYWDTSLRMLVSLVPAFLSWLLPPPCRIRRSVPISRLLKEKFIVYLFHSLTNFLLHLFINFFKREIIRNN